VLGIPILPADCEDLFPAIAVANIEREDAAAATGHARDLPMQAG